MEIGSFCGLSTNAITHFKEKYARNNALFSCDRWEFEGGGKGGTLSAHSCVTRAEYRQHVKDSFMRNVSLFSRSQLPYAIEVSSDEFFSAWRKGTEVLTFSDEP
ncbi:MAG: hypothetical protein ACREU7_14815 [Burkholderiales bacterium]